MKTAIAATLLLVLAASSTPAPADTTEPPKKAAEHAGDNAAVIYWQAFAELPEVTGDRWRQQGRALTDPLNAPLDETVKKMVQEARPSLEQLSRAAKFNRVDWMIERDAGFDAPLAHVFKSRRLGQYAVLSARLKLATGQSRAAVADLLAAMHLARHLGADPYFMAFSEELGIESNVLLTAAANLKQMDDPAMKDLVAGMEALPAGGSMTAIMSDGRRRVAGLVQDLRTAGAKADLSSLLQVHFGKQAAAALPNLPKEQFVAAMKLLLDLAAPCEKAMQIPDDKIEQFERQRTKLGEEIIKIMRACPRLPGVLTLCCDVTDRYLEGRIRVLEPMLRAAIAYRQGGKAAFDRIRDPYGSGPFELTLSDGQAKLTSKLCVGSVVIEQTFTLPAKR